jgi:IS30 family transposase
MSRGHLTQEERYQAHALREAGLSLRVIGKRMHRSASTICRELKRNRCPAGYSPDPAHTRARQRRHQASKRPRIDPSHWPRIEALLREDHSPEQIAGATGLASHERIYQHIAADHRRGGSLHTLLRQSKPRRGRRCRPDRRGQIKHRRDISERPPVVEERSRIGDWELDTMVKANGGQVLVTLTERRSRLHLIRRVSQRTAEAVSRAIIGTLAPIQHLVHTLTADNGKEFAEHEIIAIACKADFYFAEPYASWQRGSNENGNGLVRYYLPKGTDFATVSDERLQEIERRINSRPRKTLGWRTPYEVFAEALKKRVAIRS